MNKSAKIRDLAANGRTPAEIVRELKVTRQAVHNALQRQDRGVAIDQGKSGCKISVWLTEELCAAIEKAQRKSETRSDTITRLLERGIARTK